MTQYKNYKYLAVLCHQFAAVVCAIVDQEGFVSVIDGLANKQPSSKRVCGRVSPCEAFKFVMNLFKFHIQK